MIKVLRITLAGNTPYENVTILEPHEAQEQGGFPLLFEDSQFMFSCKDGKFACPDYQVIAVHLKKGRFMPPPGSTKVARIRLEEDLSYQQCGILSRDQWGEYGVPMIFREFEQLVFVNKEGIFITSDFNVRSIQY